MVYARLKFTQHGSPRTALLTDRGWNILQGDWTENSLLNHICPLPELELEAIADCARRAADLLKGDAEIL